MLNRVGRHVRSNIIGYVCLAWLMAGTAVAATHLPSHSVGAKQLRKAAVTNRKIHRGAVTKSKVKRDGLTGRQILESSLGTVPRAGNADRLGGLAAASYQRQVNGTCSGGAAIRQVNGDGSVVCQDAAKGTVTKVTAGDGLTGGGDAGEVTLAADPAVVQKRVTTNCGGTAIDRIDETGGARCAPQQLDAISETVDLNHGLNFGNRGDIDIGLSCGDTNNAKFMRMLLFNESGTPAVLNWTFNDGTTQQTSGTSMDAGTTPAVIDSAAGRIEGQFILSQLPDQEPAGQRAVTTLSLHAFNGGGGCEISGTSVKALG
jgi:hypothetical protein